MRIRMTRMTGLIVVAMMLAIVPTASAAVPFTWVGNVTYSTNGTWVPDGWTIQMENLNESYVTEPWDQVTCLYVMWNARCDGDSSLGDDTWVYVNVTSPDEEWFGEFSARLGDMEKWLGSSTHIHPLVVYPVVQQPDTFTKSLPLGWNLISLPLTPLDSSTGAVLGNATIAYDAVKQYDATTKTFADATTMAPGTGYFVHVTTAGDWVYEGTSVSSTSPGLKSGLNMIGVPNCTMDVSAAMGTADYRYVARWNADDQKYEVYNPSAPAAFYGFTEMTAGEGYFVSAKSDNVDWTVSCLS